MSKKVLNITLYKSELIYEVQNRAYLTAKSLNNGKNAVQVANMQVGEEEADLNLILRSIGNAEAELKKKLAEYCVVPDAEKVNDILPDDRGNISLELMMPGNFNRGASDVIASGCHQYIVNRALADWFAVMKLEEADRYVSLASNCLLDVREAMNKRVRPIKSN